MSAWRVRIIYSAWYALVITWNSLLLAFLVTTISLAISAAVGLADGAH